MPSRFPGMDPFIEGQVWEDFHSKFVVVTSEVLTQQVRPRYVVRVERRVYLETTAPDERHWIRPDVPVLDTDPATPRERPGYPGTKLAADAFVLTLPIPEEIRESYLTIVERTTMKLVTILELLSPTNKKPGSDGREAYLDKRREIIQSKTNLVEIDLLRGGQRLPTVEPLPSADYYVFVSPGSRRPRVEVRCCSLRKPLPKIQIPLAGADGVELDLQAVFQTVYDRAGYDYSLDYRSPAEPPLPADAAAWATGLLATAAP